MMKFLKQKLGKFSLNRVQRLLLFGAATLWFLSTVLSIQCNYQDSWILEGIFWPFVVFVTIFLVIFWMEDDNRIVAILCSMAVVTILLIPSLKYKQLYGQAVDSVAHYQIINSLIMTGKVPSSIYQTIAGMHSWVASMGLSSGLSASDAMKLGLPLAGGILPLLFYWICRRIQMPSDLTKYMIGLSCLTTYPQHLVTGTGFTLVPFILFLGILLIREYYCTLLYDKFIYTLLALIVLVQLTIWHSTTPLILLIVLVSISLTPILVWLATGRRTKVRINFHFIQIDLLATILILGYHAITTDRVFSIVFNRFYQLVIAENHPADIVPGSLFKLTLLEAMRVYVVMYGREAILFFLATFGFFVIWRHHKRYDRLLPFYTYWLLIVVTFTVAIPLSLAGVDFRRLLWIPLSISPFFAGFTIWWWKQQFARKSSVFRWFGNMVGLVLILTAVGNSVVEFFPYQPLIPKSKSLTPDTPDEYSVWLHQVNTAYQQRMITFAETYSKPETDFDFDILGLRQYMRYYPNNQSRSVYLPLAPYMGLEDYSKSSKEKLFLLHWPEKAGGYGEQVKLRSVKYLTNLINTTGWGLIYDNGESFIIQIP